MRKIIVLISTAFLINIVNAQDKNILDNIAKAKESNGVEYNSDGSVKKEINLNKVESFYKWAESGDTTGVIDNNLKWDITSLMSTLEQYRNTTYDYTDVINKCQMVTESLRMKNANMQVATVVEP